MSTKRKRTLLTIKEKHDAIRQVENSSLLINIVSNYGVGTSTVMD